MALFDHLDGHRSVIANDHRELGRGHAERLVPMIAALPDKGRADRILVSLGPGSFTGVRIGIATARALGVAWGAEVLGYPTLGLIAAQAREQRCAPDREQIMVCMNGGHGEWFVQDFPDRVGDDMLSLTPDAAKNACTFDIIAGNRANELAAMFPSGKIALDILPDARTAAVMDGMLLSDNLSPIYGRAPDAVPQTPIKTQAN